MSMGVFILILTFGCRELIFIIYGWWLAGWSNDESHRHKLFNNCTNLINQKIYRIYSMNETEWNEYRNHRFDIYCS